MAALAIARSHESVWCSSGVHPLYSNQGPHDWDNLRLVASDPKCVAWGELGLDNHYSEPARTVQDAVLAEQLAFIESCRRNARRGRRYCLPVRRASVVCAPRET